VRIDRAPAGVVLTGGASSRMGADKATMQVDGCPMAVRVADALWEAGCRTVMCRGGDVAALEAMGLEALPDVDPGAGPLRAILASLSHAEADIVVAACDLVNLDGETVRAVLDAGAEEGDHMVAVASADGRRHMLSAWSYSALGELERIVANGATAYQAAFDELPTLDVTVDSLTLHNVNSPTDL
jgi:molybdopterin-guanine dinucleotide biosynthesis protein A